MNALWICLAGYVATAGISALPPQWPGWYTFLRQWLLNVSPVMQMGFHQRFPQIPLPEPQSGQAQLSEVETTVRATQVTTPAQ